ncbi:MAG: glycosyltransferase family A protein [Tateyamaria sp.]|uniref:glycosyltransferase n=1 Tax=Tateyamaria sp. TaxID=1929288 RepID=UPI00329CFAFE
MSDASKIVAVVIGRNEGPRLITCLSSLIRQVDRIIYVDSGSTDGSIEHARSVGARVVVLPVDKPFTAARARNAGLQAAKQLEPAPDLIQFIDGDCELVEGWIARAKAFLKSHPKVAVVCGRRRERFPEASRYNNLIDKEWDTPIGQTRSCGGDALMRRAPLEEVGGYNPDLIAGEEPELCVRLRRNGWDIWRIDAEMTLHDAAIIRFAQWWQRARRAGHAYAEGAALHGASAERHNVTPLIRALFWGAILPLLALLGMVVTPWSLLLPLALPVQMLRLRRRGMDLDQAVFLTVGKFPEAQGVLTYLIRRFTRGDRRLIEYK